MLHQLQRIVDVGLPLNQVLERWTEISRGLAESPRKRRLQTRFLS